MRLAIKCFLLPAHPLHDPEQGLYQLLIIGEDVQGRLEMGNRLLVLALLHRDHPLLPVRPVRINMVWFFPDNRFIKGIGLGQSPQRLHRQPHI